jgi:hypothetical protein
MLKNSGNIKAVQHTQILFLFAISVNNFVNIYVMYYAIPFAHVCVSI